MQINNNSQTANFKAKFYDSPALREIVKYAVEHGRAEDLNRARLNIDSSYLRTKLYVDVFEKKGRPVIAFSSFVPNDHLQTTPVTYKYVRTVEYPSSKPENIYAYALRKLISLGNDVPNNKMYKKIVTGKKS